MNYELFIVLLPLDYFYFFTSYDNEKITEFPYGTCNDSRCNACRSLFSRG